MVEVLNKVEKIEKNDSNLQHKQDLSTSAWQAMEHAAPKSNTSSNAEHLDMTDPYKTKETGKGGCPAAGAVEAGKPAKIEQGQAESSVGGAKQSGTESGDNKPRIGSEQKEPAKTNAPEQGAVKGPENKAQSPQADNIIHK